MVHSSGLFSGFLFPAYTCYQKRCFIFFASFRKPVFGGKNYYSASGNRAGWSAGSFLGGETIHLDGISGPERSEDDTGSFDLFGDFPDDN